MECIARVLPVNESFRAAILAGIREDRIVAGRGPFSTEENRAVIRKFKIGVLVTKDSGVAGGLPEKVEAARLENCRIVIVRRPNHASGAIYENISDLLQALKDAVPRVGNRAGE